MTQHPVSRPKSAKDTDYLSVDEYDDIISEDAEWEDQAEHPTKGVNKKPKERATAPGDSPNIRSTPRRRKTARIMHSPRKQSFLPSSSRASSTGRPYPNDDILSRDAVVDGTLKGAVFTSRYLLDVFSTAINLLRKPVSFLLFLWLLGVLMAQVSRTLRPVFLPLCMIPGISSSRMCHFLDVNTSPRKPGFQGADYPKLVDVQSKTFGHLMDEVVGGSALSLEIKKAEMATTDLVALVKISDLKARDTLALSLTEFVEDAKRAGRGLQKLTSKVGGAVDNIMAVNDYALRTIEDARNTRPALWSFSSLVPWKSNRLNVDLIVERTFEEAMNVLSINMERLILEAEKNYQNLNALEERLATLHEIISREDSSLASAKTDLLADLWSKLGGNRKSLRNFEGHLVLLRELGTYRKRALIHVVAALQTLRAMSEDMEDMRERVAGPNLMGPTVPVEVHMKSLQMGLERLRDGRTKAKRLEEDARNRILSIDESDEDA